MPRLKSNTAASPRHAHVGDVAAVLILGGGLAYEIAAMILGEELLSMVAARYRARHKWVWTLASLALGGHLGGWMPYQLDIFSERNLIHQRLAALWPNSAPPWCRYFARLLDEWKQQ